MDFAPLIARKEERFRDLEKEVAAESLYADPKRARDLLREHTRLKELLSDWDKLQKLERQIQDKQEVAEGEGAERAQLAAAELPELQGEAGKLAVAVQAALLPPDPNEDRDAI